MLSSALVLAVLGAYGWRHRWAPGALPFALLMFLSTPWALGGAARVAASDIATKVFWIRFQVIWLLPAAVASLWFAIEYANLGRWLTRSLLALLAIPSVFVPFLVFTNDVHHLIWRGFAVSEHVYPIPGTLGRFLIGYGMLLAFAASLLFLWLFARSPLHRWPAGLCLLGQTVVEAGYLLDKMYPNLLGATDLTVLAFTFTGSMYALALFHFRLFDLVPVGRGTVIDQMQEGMLILDRRRRVLDVNPAAERMLGLSAAAVRGTHANSILRSSSGAGLDLDVDESEITLLPQQGSPRHYELSISALKNRDVRLGHVILLHDVSEQRRAQDLLDSELAHAANYVLSLIPPRLGEGEVQTSWLYMPSEQLGGDSLGYHWIDSSHFAVYLLDVSGHGVGPALLSISVLNALRTQCLPDADFLLPEQVLAALNTRFRTDDQYGHFFTIWYGVFNRSDRMLRYASGGHPPAVLIDGQGHRTDLDAPGVPIGLLGNAAYDPAFAHIMPASRVYVFSDGCYEIQRANSEWWTREEMVSFITKAGFDDGFELEGLYRHVMRIREGRSLVDDFSILCVRFV